MLQKNKENTNANISIRLLWQERFFKVGRTLQEVADQIAKRWDHNFSSPDISKALKKAKFLTRTGKRGYFRYIQKISPVSKKVESIENQLFSEELIKKLGISFKVDIEDLHYNFGKSGNCTAFLLRKILEKAIYLAFAKKSIAAKLEDKNKTGRLVGLEAMLDTATREKFKGIPFLLPKTTKEIKGIKFLGDISAHNPLVNVDMETILPQIPFIITAYKELAERL